MELRAYWKIIRRRWWLPVGLVLLVLVFTLAMQRPWQAKPTTFSANMRFNVGIQPERVPGVYTFDRYYTMLTSEYLVDDLGEIVRSQVFAQEVSKRLAEKGIVVPAGAIGASTQPGKLHRILTVNVGWPNALVHRRVSRGGRRGTASCCQGHRGGGPGRQILLSGWCLVENTTDQDWDHITLSLVAGMPVSFKCRCSGPSHPAAARRTRAAPRGPSHGDLGRGRGNRVRGGLKVMGRRQV